MKLKIVSVAVLTVLCFLSVQQIFAENLEQCDEIPARELFARADALYEEVLPDLIRAKMYMDDISEEKATALMDDRYFRDMVICAIGNTPVYPEQMVVTALYASHVGPQRAFETPFIKALEQEENWCEAAKEMVTDKTSRKDKKYFWMLITFWRGNVMISEASEMPNQSYKDVRLKDMFTDGTYRFDTEILMTLLNIEGD